MGGPRTVDEDLGLVKRSSLTETTNPECDVIERFYFEERNNARLTRSCTLVFLVWDGERRTYCPL